MGHSPENWPEMSRGEWKSNMGISFSLVATESCFFPCLHICKIYIDQIQNNGVICDVTTSSGTSMARAMHSFSCPA